MNMFISFTKFNSQTTFDVILNFKIKEKTTTKENKKIKIKLKNT